MSILDQLLGGSDRESVNAESNSSDFDFGAAPGFALGASDILRSSNREDDNGDMESNDFVGIGDVGLGFASPIVIGTSSSSESASASSVDGDNGGLLGGLL
jgi:hypothetical protein